jgi:GNAT superfamily N-acetyltransferase
MKAVIRTFTPDDYEGVVKVYNAAIPDYPTTVQEMQEEDKHVAPHCKFKRWVAEHNGKIVGAAHYEQRADRYHPQKFWIDGYVHPQFERQGIGTALYETVTQALQSFDPILAFCGVEADRDHSVRFLLKRGVQESSRHWISRLNLEKFDLRPYAQTEEKLRAAGIAIKSFSELSDDPDRNQKLFDLWWAIQQDIPAAGGATPTPITFEHYVETRLTGPKFMPDGYFVALHNSDYVGTSAFWGAEERKIIRNGITGIKREYRRRGIALALKIKGIEYAKQQGYEKIETQNNSINRPMLSINEALGFEKQPAIIVYKKIFREE